MEEKRPSAPEILLRQSDEALMARVASGGQDALEVLLSRYERAVVTFCYAFMRDRDLAEDLAQDTFLRVYRGAARYRPIAKFSTWLYRIAANLCINELKKRKLRKAVSLDDPAGPDPEGTRIIEQLASSGEPPSSEAEKHDLQGHIRRAIEHLPHDQRITLTMVEFHHMPYKEIAEVLRVSLSAVKMRVKRARETLREALRLLGGTGG